MKTKILESFDLQKKDYNDFRLKLEKLVTELLSLNGINPHMITSRLKTKDSLSEKIDLKFDKYSKLEEITDIVGLRIITYLESEISLVSKIIENEFLLDINNSVDKRKLKADQFGYKSLHYVVSIKNPRCLLPEYKRYENFKAEIQIRSILQHGWAEIEHDLGYKGEFSIPESYRRDFNRVSALLETADIEFDRLKSNLQIYENDINKIIRNNDGIVELNQTSILAIMKTNRILQECTQILVKKGFQLIPTKDLKHIIQKFDFFEIRTIKQLETLLKENQSTFLKFFEEYLKNVVTKSLSDLTPLLYFQHYMSATKENLNYILEYFEYGDSKFSSYNNAHIKILDVYKLIKYPRRHGQRI